MPEVSRRAAVATLLGLSLMVPFGCSGDVEPTEEGRQADMKAMQDSAAANDKAAKASSRSVPKNNVGVMPP